MRGGGGGELGGIGPGDEVFCSIRFLASIDHGGRRRPTAAMKPHSRLLSIQQISQHTRQQVSIVKTRKSYH